jgi:acetyl-CoA synthetase
MCSTKMLIKRASTYDEIYRSFQWTLPPRYNISVDVCERHAAYPDKIALIHEKSNGTIENYTFLQMNRLANQFANVLSNDGLKRGDRVFIYLGQDPATAVAHVACWKAGLISVPCSVLFGPDALRYRLRITEATVLVTDLANFPKVAEIWPDLNTLQTVYLVDGKERGTRPFWETLQRASDQFETVDTALDEPAFINFTSGTTGWPKGALQAHRSMIGHMPGAEFLFDLFPQHRDVMWSPADWAWLAGLMDVLMPAWFHGIPVLTYRAPRFDAEQAFHMIGKHKVRTTILTPTMLKLMRQVPDPINRFGVELRSVVSGSESVGRDLLEWASDMLKVHINEGYGQTECNLVLGNCSEVSMTRLGSLGRSMPGHVGAIVDDHGNLLKPGELGNLAFKRPDPVMLLEYWRNPEATSEKFVGDWLITGDLAECDEEGFFWFRGRVDDVITSSGYRIGPGEIEDALVSHPAVQIAAVIGVPDSERTESIKAFIVLAPNYRPSNALSEEISATVRNRLAKHEYPREIEFVDALPMTATGKILRRELRQREKEKNAEPLP